MKISKIKKKLDKLFGVDSEDSNDENIESMKTLVELLKQKEVKFNEKLLLTESEEDIQTIKQKLSLIKKQIKKAEAHLTQLNEE